MDENNGLSLETILSRLTEMTEKLDKIDKIDKLESDLETRLNDINSVIEKQNEVITSITPQVMDIPATPAQEPELPPDEPTEEELKEAQKYIY